MKEWIVKQILQLIVHLRSRQNSASAQSSITKEIDPDTMQRWGDVTKQIIIYKTTSLPYTYWVHFQIYFALFTQAQTSFRDQFGVSDQLISGAG